MYRLFRWCLLVCLMGCQQQSLQNKNSLVTQSEPADQSQPQPAGVLTQITKQSYTTPPDFPDLYGRLEITTTIKRPTLQGPEATTFGDSLATMIGFGDSRNFGVVLSIYQNGVRLSDIVPFSYSKQAGG